MCMTASDHQPIRVRTLEVLWHGCERDEEAVQLGLQSVAIEGIVSVDYNMHNDRIVTCGGDGHIRLWQLHLDAIDNWLANSQCDMTACVSFVFGMRTSCMPLTARWSPYGSMIASAHCDGKICLWWPEKREDMKEEWKDYRHLSGHVIDVYDLCFSPDSRYLISAGGDGSIVIHDLEGSTVPVVQLSEAHHKFCRGVAWDPWCRYIASFGGGPSLLFFTHAPKVGAKRVHLAGQRKAPGDFIGESCATTFRRLGWSPDGSLLAVPYGRVPHHHHPKRSNDSGAGGGETGRADDMVHCVYLYMRNAPEKVAGRLVVRGHSELRGVLWAPCFLPPLESNTEDKDKVSLDTALRHHCTLVDRGSWGPDDYRMIMAVWTADAVIVYTTDSAVRHSDYTDLHMRSISDVAWSPNAAYLLTASLDGYISVISTGGSLSVAHKLPLFSTKPVTVALCQLLSEIKTAGKQLELGRGCTTSNMSASKSSGGSGGGGTVVHVPVKKKREVMEMEGDNAKRQQPPEKTVTRQPGELVPLSELADIMSGI